MKHMQRFAVALVFGTFLLLPIFAQDNPLPEYGDIADVKNLHKVYLIADATYARKLILKELKQYPSLTVVKSPDDAEFFIEYKVLKQTTDLPEMVVYWLRDKRRVIAWSKTRLSANPFKLNEVELTRDFLKALKKVRGEKKT